MNEYITIEQRIKLIDELTQLEEKLNNKPNNAEKKDILYDVVAYHEIIDSVFPKYKKQIHDYSQKDLKVLQKYENVCNLLEINEIISELDIYKELCNNINKIFKYKKKFKDLLKENKNLTQSNLIIFKMLLDNYFPKSFSSFANKEIENGKLFLADDYKNMGRCFNIMSFNEKFCYYLCEISNGITFYDFFTIIHELVHGYIFYNKEYYNETYSEVYSHFYEMKLSNAIFKKYGLTNDEKNHDTYFLNNIFACNNEMLENLNYIRQISKYENTPKNIESRYNEESHIYLIAYILGLKLYYQDLEDTELAHYNINKIYDWDYYNRLSEIDKLEHISLEEIISGEPVKKFIKETNEKWTSNKK